jgi:C1A family cysteine protease
MGAPLDLQELRSDLENAGQPWVMDENTSMARLTEEERVRRLGFVPPPGEMSLEEAVRADEAAAAVTPDVIAAEAVIGAPAAFDHRNVGGRDFTTPVKNQGGCGSCVAFGVVAVMETTYRRQINNADFAVDLSEAHLFYCHGAEMGRHCGNGWWPDQALDKARDKSVTFEAMYPYTGTQQSCQVQAGWQNHRAWVTGRTKLDTRAKMKDWISTRGSITGCFLVYQDFFSYKSGVYKHVSGDAVGGHCVEIIGYSDSQGCWICKNSWGTNWGEAGFFRIAYGQCNIETWSGPHGANSVALRTMAYNLTLTRAYANTYSKNAWAAFDGLGWRRIHPNAPDGVTNVFGVLAASRANERKVHAQLDGQYVYAAYGT